MSSHVRTLCLCAALLAPTTGWAKPPDLPLRETDQCKEHRPGTLAAGLADEVNADEPAVTIDTLSPVGGLLLVRWLTADISDILNRWYAYAREAFATATTEAAPYSRTPTELVQKIYPVRDLIYGEGAAVRLMAKRFNGSAEQRLMDCIKGVIEPRSWSDQGGPGTIRYLPKGKVLVVNQTVYHQEQVAELMAALRRLDASGQSEEQEVDANSEGVFPGNRPGNHIEVQVAELLEACQRAYADGRYREAAELASRALRLDSGCAAAQTLLSRARANIGRSDKRSAD